jgi:glycosyltransferase involved in cell wall biosynthesis
VATHQVHLARGLAAAGIEAPLLATNTCVPVERTLSRDGGPDGSFELWRSPRPHWSSPAYVAAVDPRRAATYALRLIRKRPGGSRREALTNLLWYRRFLAQVQPDLVHVQHPLERCSYARLVQRFERWTLPLVVTAHSLFGEHPDQVIHTLMAPNLRAADRVIAVSEHIADQAIDLGVDSRRIRVIRSGVDTEWFRPRDRLSARRRLDLQPDAPIVLFVGNLEPRKQVDVLVRAIALAHERLPDVLLLVVGSGESAGVQNQTAPLLRLTGELGLRQIVRFVGRVDEQLLLEYYAAADLFALASSSEAQGIVALEAMACGLPVVATAVGGLLGTVEDGDTGWLVPPGAVEALADRLLDVLVNPTKRKSIGAAARRAVEQEFSWQRSVEATIAVYRDLPECAR